MGHELSVSAPIVDWALERIDEQLNAVRVDMLQAERHYAARLSSVPDPRRESARNLVHYLAMRQHDLRPLQARLAAHGLSSLGRAEAHALPAIEAVLSVVRRLAGLSEAVPHGDPLTRLTAGRELLDAHTVALLGPSPGGRDVRIMVTMPSEAAGDYALVRSLLGSGMDCMRINAAHDDASAWTQMLEHLERARRQLARPCSVVVDVAGPKPRTGALEPLSPVVRWRPDRDRYGRVHRAARVWLTAQEHPVAPTGRATAVLPVSGSWLNQLAVGDTIKLFDARDAARELKVVACAADGIWAESEQTAYVTPGITLHLTRPSSHGATEVGELPAQPGSLRLVQGDTLILRRDRIAGAAAVRGADGTVLQPASIGVTLPEVLDDVRVGEAIWLDDGKIGGVIRNIEPARVEVAITRTTPGGGTLAADKGVNLPDSALRLPSLTDKDREDLRVLDGRVDLVGYSFVRSAEDVDALQSYLNVVSKRELGIILKIETRHAFEHLPSLLLAAMRSPASGVMIARGDLAVECGYERLAEVQEEILWMAEASHTPVIWATQVLENLAKEGLPSRAEITDAAMSERAECVMLNKGPYIVEAVRTLDDILVRMQSHQQKKRPMLRDLALARRFLGDV